MNYRIFRLFVNAEHTRIPVGTVIKNLHTNIVQYELLHSKLSQLWRKLLAEMSVAEMPKWICTNSETHKNLDYEVTEIYQWYETDTDLLWEQNNEIMLTWIDEIEE